MEGLSSFLDEIEKISSDWMRGVVIGSTISNTIRGLSDLSIGGKKSFNERRFEEKHKDVDVESLEGKEKKKYESALRRHRINREAALGTLVGTPSVWLGIGAAKKIGRSIDPVEVENGIEIALRLQKELAPTTKMVGVKGLHQAMMIPEGGVLPKPLRAIEEQMYESRGMPMDEVRKAINSGGAVFVPMKDPSIVGHELGHASLRSSPLKSKLWSVGRVGLPIAASIAAVSMVSSDDPKDWKVKAAPAVAAAGMAPILLEEALASHRGLKALKKVAPDIPAEAVVKMRNNLRKALGTYGAIAVGAGLMPVLAVSMSRSLHEKKEGET